MKFVANSILAANVMKSAVSVASVANKLPL